MRDEIYKSTNDISKFTFDEKVVEVFDDMVLRSVPGYKQMIELIGLAGRIYPTKNSNIYDLGCSTGAVTMSLISNISAKNVKVFSIDNSKVMINRCRKNLSSINENIEYICDDINNIQFKNASLVVLNLTLQFVHPKKRISLINKIYESLLPNGALIVSEKYIHMDKKINKNLTDLHESFKKENGYSNTEIARKRRALEDVLIPETIEKHIFRFKESGFVDPMVIFKCLNFCTFLAKK